VISRERLQEAAGAAIGALRSAVESGEVPGAAFAVAHDRFGEVLTSAFGVADAASGAAVGADTPFSLASTTKPIATTVLAALAAEGVLAFDDPVRGLVPELPHGPCETQEPTLLQVASHTAGVGMHHRFFYDDEVPPVPVQQAVAELARPAFPVGRLWRYSNLGYGVLQLAMERAAGESMAGLVQRHVYTPLGMRSSGWGGAHGPDGSAARHRTPTEVLPGYVTDHPPASEAWCAIGDLVSFGLAHVRGSLVPPEWQSRLTEPTAPRQPDGAAYGLGWVTREYGGHRLLVHAGRMGGVAAHLALVPSLGLVVAGLANIETDRVSEAVASVLAALVPGYAPPPADPGWVVGAAHPSMTRRWEGLALLGSDAIPVALDATSDRIRVEIGSVGTDLWSPHVQPGGVRGHVGLAIDHPLAPAGSICHVDLVPYEPNSTERLVGALVAARYPEGERPRQRDAVSAAVMLERVG
jgi:CubicO group peptidase (beta-lactamase class C family)